MLADPPSSECGGHSGCSPGALVGSQCGRCGAGRAGGAGERAGALDRAAQASGQAPPGTLGVAGAVSLRSLPAPARCGEDSWALAI